MSTKERWRGLKELALDAVENGSMAIERVHTAAAKKTFDALEQIPQIEKSVKEIHVLHDKAVSGVYGIIRLVNEIVGETVDVALGDAVEPNLSSPSMQRKHGTTADAEKATLRESAQAPR